MLPMLKFDSGGIKRIHKTNHVSTETIADQ